MSVRKIKKEKLWGDTELTFEINGVAFYSISETLL
jgi:hypothetical protein